MTLAERAYTKFMVETGREPLPWHEVPKIVQDAWGSVVQAILERAATEAVAQRKVLKPGDLREKIAKAIRQLGGVEEKQPLKAVRPNHLPRVYD